MATHYKSPTGWEAYVVRLEDLEPGARFKMDAGDDSPVYVRGGRQDDGMVEYHRLDIDDHGLFYGGTNVYWNWPLGVPKFRNFSTGEIEQFFATYQIWAEPEQVITLVQNAYMKAKDVNGTREFHIIVQDKGWTYRIGCRFFVKDGVRIGVLFPYVYNVTIADITGDDWETTIYHEELEE